jgi:hypothetical protein
MNSIQMAEIREIAFLLSIGNRGIASLLSLVNRLADAAATLGLSLHYFHKVASSLEEITTPLHKVEQIIWAALEAAPFRFRNMSDEAIELPDGKKLEPRNIISLDSEERHSAEYSTLIDEKGVLVPLDD